MYFLHVAIRVCVRTVPTQKITFRNILAEEENICAICARSKKKRIFIHLFSDRINVVTHTHSYTYVCLRIDIIIKKD